MNYDTFLDGKSQLNEDLGEYVGDPAYPLL